MARLKPVIMRANRLLGATLVEKQLVSIDDLDLANERLLELMSVKGNEVQKVSLLSILLNEQQCLSEQKLMTHLVEDEGLGIVDIRNFEVPEDVKDLIRLDECWSTWTVPFDSVEDTLYLASAYYLSPVVREFWEEKFNGKIVWYASTIESISEFLEGVEADRAKLVVANGN
ncbi:hypothetical protein MLD52_03190 [Puniceicoccaceae bacterium K14]|nr:hypothetical protein [Puniceicoccaceae bacterium K14]